MSTGHKHVANLTMDITGLNCMNKRETRDEQNLPLMKYKFLFILSLLRSIYIIFIVLSISKSFQSCVLSSYKIKVSASASLRFDSGDVSKQSNVDVPRWSLRFKIGGQWTFSDPLICAALNDRNERQSRTMHFWLRELTMFTTVSGARGQINMSLSSIATILFDSAMIWPITDLRWLSLFTERKLYTNGYVVMDRPLLLWAHFCVLNWIQLNKPAFIFSLFPPSSHVTIFIMHDVIEGGFVTSCRISRVCPDLLFPFTGGKLIPRRQMNNIKTISKTFRSWQKCYQVL